MSSIAALTDSKWVVFQSGEVDPRAWKVPIDGGEPIQLITTRATRPVVSPDGKMIAYSYLDVELDEPRWGIGSSIHRRSTSSTIRFPANGDLPKRPMVTKRSIDRLR